MCCLSKLPQVVSIADAEKFKEQMALPNLTFVTHQNQTQMRAAPEMQNYFDEKDKAEAEAREKEEKLP